ncbi:MAG: SAM-dependent methyltransferase [Candidatus Neomarinimicrobiota bacterium]|nr:MAG: SAM-dependent methyltransferase [Candidatus Neomarinimicrobiota bacterium]
MIRPLLLSVGAIPLRSAQVQRARRRIAPFLDWLRPHERLLDVGTGTGAAALLLQTQNSVVAMDVRPELLFPDIPALVYDGVRIPFPDHTFDTVVLLTVLHHCTRPLTLARECRRVGRQVIVVEDLISSPWNRRWTRAVDRILNLEFRRPPQAQASHRQWMTRFQALGFQVEEVRFRRAVTGVQLGYYRLTSR